jgi:hypothetical protein
MKSNDNSIEIASLKRQIEIVKTELLEAIEKRSVIINKVNTLADKEIDLKKKLKVALAGDSLAEFTKFVLSNHPEAEYVGKADGIDDHPCAMCCREDMQLFSIPTPVCTVYIGVCETCHHEIDLTRYQGGNHANFKSNQ